MARGDREVVVPDGTPLPIATSALVKALRRGREVEALYWAKQMERGRFHWYVWRRLCTFAAEDVGIADPQAVVVVNALAEAYERHKEHSSKPVPDGPLLAFAVLYLARAPKSREVDDFDQAVFHLQEDEGWSAPVPDYALDLHTPEGKDRKHRLRHWLDVSSLVVDRQGPLDWLLWIRRWAARRGHLDRQQVEEQAQRWAAEGRLRFGEAGYSPREPG
jgi:replication-associated recombination protein RarA